MFESRTEKGLFTFYWEQWQENQLPGSLSFRKSTKELELGDQIAEHDGRDIEEKKMNKNSGIKRQPKQKTQKIEYLHSQDNSSKENRFTKPILKIDLSSSLSKQIEDRAFRMVTNKETQNKLTTHKHKKSCQLPALVKQDTSRSKINICTTRGGDIFEKLIVGEQALEPIKLNLEISQNASIKEEEKVARSKRMKKTLKSDKTLRRIKQLDRKMNNKFECNCPNISKETPTYKFPILGPSPKKLKQAKDPYMIEKIVLDRQEINRSNSSVILLGINAGDEYKMRWQKRKQQFLHILSRNMSCNLRQ